MQYNLRIKLVFMELQYLIIEAHVHPTIQHDVLTTQGHQYTTTTNI